MRVCSKFNTPIPTLDFAIISGVKVDNNGVKTTLASLVGGKIVSVSTNKLNQEVYSFAPAIKLLLHHKILPPNHSYIEKVAQGNKCITNQVAALQAKRLKASYQHEDTDPDDDMVRKAYNVDSDEDLDLVAV